MFGLILGLFGILVAGCVVVGALCFGVMHGRLLLTVIILICTALIMGVLYSLLGGK